VDGGFTLDEFAPNEFSVDEATDIWGPTDRRCTDAVAESEQLALNHFGGLFTAWKDGFAVGVSQ
jgi:hypothetical protein